MVTDLRLIVHEMDTGLELCYLISEVYLKIQIKYLQSTSSYVNLI